MGKGDRFWRVEARKKALRDAEVEGRTADSMEVRLALMDQVRRGEITLEAAQTELKRIKRGAKASGKVTRAQAFRGL